MTPPQASSSLLLRVYHTYERRIVIHLLKLLTNSCVHYYSRRCIKTLMCNSLSYLSDAGEKINIPSKRIPSEDSRNIAYAYQMIFYRLPIELDANVFRRMYFSCCDMFSTQTLTHLAEYHPRLSPQGVSTKCCKCIYMRTLWRSSETKLVIVSHQTWAVIGLD